MICVYVYRCVTMCLIQNSCVFIFVYVCTFVSYSTCCVSVFVSKTSKRSTQCVSLCVHQCSRSVKCILSVVAVLCLCVVFMSVVSLVVFVR